MSVWRRPDHTTMDNVANTKSAIDERFGVCDGDWLAFIQNIFGEQNTGFEAIKSIGNDAMRAIDGLNLYTFGILPLRSNRNR